MSVCTTSTCPHNRGVFIWLGDGPWHGPNPADPDHGRYPWVHDTTAATARGHLEVCDRMPFATPEEAGEMCGCRHPSGDHHADPGPLPHGLIAKPRACPCGCPDFRHRPEDIARHRERQHAHALAVSGEQSAAAAAPAPAETAQLSLFGDAA